LAEVNSRVFRLLGLHAIEQWLVEDFVALNLELNKGKVTDEAMRSPTRSEVDIYFITLRECLDDFLPDSQGLHHKIEAITSSHSTFFSLTAVHAREALVPTIADDGTASANLKKMRERLRQRHSQWVYFDRSLRRY